MTVMTSIHTFGGPAFCHTRQVPQILQIFMLALKDQPSLMTLAIVSTLLKNDTQISHIYEDTGLFIHIHQQKMSSIDASYKRGHSE